MVSFVEGCLFHWVRSIKNKGQKLGWKPVLTWSNNSANSEYDPTFVLHFRMITVLPLIPVGHVRFVFDSWLWKSFESTVPRGYKNASRRFKKYLRDTWLGESAQYDVCLVCSCYPSLSALSDPTVEHVW